MNELDTIDDAFIELAGELYASIVAEDCLPADALYQLAKALSVAYDDGMNDAILIYDVLA